MAGANEESGVTCSPGRIAATGDSPGHRSLVNPGRDRGQPAQGQNVRGLHRELHLGEPQIGYPRALRSRRPQPVRCLGRSGRGLTPRSLSRPASSCGRSRIWRPSTRRSGRRAGKLPSRSTGSSMRFGSSGPKPLSPWSSSPPAARTAAWWPSVSAASRSVARRRGSRGSSAGHARRGCIW